MRELVLANQSAAPSRLARCMLLAVVGATISGCISAADNAAAVARGQALAEQYCGNCHGLGLTDISTFPDAPAMRDMHFDYDAISYERSMAQWHLGYVDMPPADIGLEDVRDIGAYISSLKRAVRRSRGPSTPTPAASEQK